MAAQMASATFCPSFKVSEAARSPHFGKMKKNSAQAQAGGKNAHAKVNSQPEPAERGAALLR